MGSLGLLAVGVAGVLLLGVLLRWLILRNAGTAELKPSGAIPVDGPTEVAMLAAEHLRPSLGPILEKQGGLSKELASDMFVNGYVWGTAYAIARVLAQQRIRDDQVGIAVFAAMTALLGGDAETAKSWLLGSAPPDDPDYVRGMRSAAKVVAVYAGRPAFDSDPEVQRAKIEAKERVGAMRRVLGESVPETLMAAACLKQTLFGSYLERTY